MPKQKNRPGREPKKEASRPKSKIRQQKPEVGRRTKRFLERKTMLETAATEISEETMAEDEP